LKKIPQIFPIDNSLSHSEIQRKHAFYLTKCWRTVPIITLYTFFQHSPKIEVFYDSFDQISKLRKYLTVRTTSRQTHAYTFSSPNTCIFWLPPIVIGYLPIFIFKMNVLIFNLFTLLRY